MTIKTKLKNGVAVQTTVYPSFGVPVPDYPLLMEIGGGKTVMLNKETPHADTHAARYVATNKS